MYTNSAYLYNKDVDSVTETKPFIVLSAGTYHLHTKTCFETVRPNGRKDIQLLYIASGKAHFTFQDEEQIVTAGNMVLYFPNEAQKYVYYGTDKTKVYWLHFTGSEATQFLIEHGIRFDEHVFYVGTPIIYETLFKEIISELQQRSYEFENLTVLYLKQLLLFIHRNRTEHQKFSNHSMLQEIEMAKLFFHNHYQESISIQDYAHSRNMSTCWFIRSFRKLTGSTPLQYLLSIRMTNARTLLEHTQYNITEVATLVGFEDPLYFSHLFKKHTGIAPSEYKKRI